MESGRLMAGCGEVGRGVSAYLYLSWGTVGLQVIKQLIRYLKNTALKKIEVEINGTHELNANLQLSVYNISNDYKQSEEISAETWTLCVPHREIIIIIKK